MDFAHYDTDAVELAIALVNTDQREFDGTDQLSDLASFKTFLEQYEDLWSGVAKRPRRDELESVRELRGALRAVVSSDDEAEASQRLNTVLAESGASPRISTHGGGPHLHFEPSESSMNSWLGAVTAMGLATVLVDHGLERFGVCRADRCHDVFVDTSRNRSRCHCSTQCSTREAVAAYRSRSRGRSA